MAKDQIAKLSSRQYINIDFNENARRILIIGNTENMFGQYADLKEAKCCDIDTNNMAEEAYQALDYFIDRLENNTRIDIIGNNDTMQYYMRMFSYLIDSEILKKNHYRSCVHFKEIKSDKEYLTFMDTVKNNGIEYDFIIQNPPYSGSFHLDFLVKGIELLKKDSGKMTIIEPATWLINLRKNGKASKYDEIKAMLKGHVSKVVIENMNKEFGIANKVPFAITSIDFSKEYNEIEFICCGEKKIVNSLYDCNMIGNHNIINSIFDKISNYDTANSHIAILSKQKTIDWYENIDNIGFMRYGNYLIGNLGSNYGANVEKCAKGISHIIKFKHCETYDAYALCGCPDSIIETKFPKGIKRGTPADCFYGSIKDLENWKYFISNNKLPLFINICLTIDEHNYSKDFIPWLVDKQYTDEEINELFHFTPEEIALIDKTIKKYDRKYSWFQRYLCGKDSVSNEEVQKFIDSL